MMIKPIPMMHGHMMHGHVIQGHVIQGHAGGALGAGMAKGGTTAFAQGGGVTGALATGGGKGMVAGGALAGGKGLSLGLGIGLGFWGPLLLVGLGAAAAYSLWRSRQAVGTLDEEMQEFQEALNER